MYVSEKAGRAAARRPASCIAAATARLPFLLARGARQFNQRSSEHGCRRSRRDDRRSALNRLRHRREVKSSGWHSTTSSTSAAPRRAHQARAAPNRRSRSFDLWRSGCNRETRRGALPSTTCWSRAPALVSPLPARMRAPRAELHQMSSVALCGRTRVCRANLTSWASPSRPKSASMSPPRLLATSRTCGHVTPGTGSRSTRSSSG